MIPFDFITRWRSHAPWVSDGQVEQDLVLSRALVELYGDEKLQRELAFRGGTALNKLFLDSPQRYSEDIDLVQVEAGPSRGKARNRYTGAEFGREDHHQRGVGEDVPDAGTALSCAPWQLGSNRNEA